MQLKTIIQINKFSAGVFCFFMDLYIFNGIQASCAGLFDTKKKEALWLGQIKHPVLWTPL